MDSNQINRQGCRPYCRTCGMMKPSVPDNNPISDSTLQQDKNSMQNINSMPLAMGYVPCQKFNKIYDWCTGLQAGTLFPELNKPFCGKRGICR